MSYNSKNIKKADTISKDNDGNVKQRIYKQKFRDCWLNSEFSPWLMRDPSDPDTPYCSFCDKTIEGGIYHVKRHAKSSQHKANTEINSDTNSANWQSTCNSIPPVDKQPSVMPHIAENPVPPTTEIAQHFASSNSHHNEVPSHIGIPHLQAQQMGPQLVDCNHSNPNELASYGVANTELTPMTAQYHEMQHSHQQAGQKILTTLANARVVKKENREYPFGDAGSGLGMAVPTTMSDPSRITVNIQGQDLIYLQPTADTMGYPTNNPNASCTDSSNMKEDTGNKPAAKQKKARKVKTVKINQKKDGEDNKSGTELTGPKRYKQKYSRRWEASKEFSDWLTRDPKEPTMAYCIACRKRLKGGIFHLRRHSERRYHKKRMLSSRKDRALLNAQKAELLLTKFALTHHISAETVCAFAPLLSKMFPEDKLCKQLSKDRLDAMMLVREEGASSGDEDQSDRKVVEQAGYSRSDGLDELTREEEGEEEEEEEEEEEDEEEDNEDDEEERNCKVPTDLLSCQYSSKHSNEQHDNENLNLELENSTDSHSHDMKNVGKQKPQPAMEQQHQPAINIPMHNPLPTTISQTITHQPTNMSNNAINMSNEHQQHPQQDYQVAQNALALNPQIPYHQQNFSQSYMDHSSTYCRSSPTGRRPNQRPS